MLYLYFSNQLPTFTLGDYFIKFFFNLGYMKMQNIHPSAASLRLGFHISPDITIEFVSPKSESTYSENPPLAAIKEEDEDDYEPYFNPLVYCAITMDDDEKKDELSYQSVVNHNDSNLASINKSKKSTRNKQSNENSSLVCNGGESQAGGKVKKRFTCHICLKTFGWTTDLKRHILIHTGERPFKCSMCFATFTRNFLLQKHKTRIHQCLSPNEVSQLNNNVAKNLMEIKLKMRELEEGKGSNEGGNEEKEQISATIST